MVLSLPDSLSVLLKEVSSWGRMRRAAAVGSSVRSTAQIDLVRDLGAFAALLIFSVAVTFAQSAERQFGSSVLVAPGAWGEPAVSPSTCPTFRWTASESGMSGEPVVYRLAEEGRSVAALALSTRLPARATGWTPSREECLDAGLYAWTVRDEQGERWADPHLFRIAEAPSADEVRKALDVLRSFLDAQGYEEGIVESGERDGGVAEDVVRSSNRDDR